MTTDCNGSGVNFNILIELEWMIIKNAIIFVNRP